jgi:hypothetical protein
VATKYRKLKAGSARNQAYKIIFFWCTQAVSVADSSQRRQSTESSESFQFSERVTDELEWAQIGQSTGSPRDAIDTLIAGK